MDIKSGNTCCEKLVLRLTTLYPIHFYEYLAKYFSEGNVL